MKYINYTKLLSFLIMVLAFMSCDQDDSVPNIPLENTTKAEIVEESITLSEGEDASFTIVQEDLIEIVSDYWEAAFSAEAYDVYIGKYGLDEPTANELASLVSGQLGIRIVGGTAIEGEDYIIKDFYYDDDNEKLFPIQSYSPFLLQDGYIYLYDASVGLEHVVSNFIDIIEDGVTEGSETIELQFFPVALGYIIIDDTITITITD